MKLSDLKPPKKHKDFGERLAFDDKSEDENGKFGFDYEKFELYEVGSDSDYESGDDFDDEDDEILGFGDGGGHASDESLGDENVFEGMPEKEKGVPAVMRCFDRAKIYVKAGDGGMEGMCM